MFIRLGALSGAGIGILVASVLPAATSTSRPGEGGAVADFTVAPVVEPFQLSRARGRFVALHFLLKTECPFCLRHVQSYMSRAGELPNVTQIFLKPDSEKDISKWLSDYPGGPGLTPILYRDPEAALARRFGIPGGYHFHDQVVHYPALVLIDPQGREVFRYVGKSNQDRFGFDQLKAKLAELAGTSR